MDAAPIIVSPASAVSDLPGVLRRGQEHLDAYVRAADGAFSAATKQAIAGDTAAFSAFAAGRGLSPIPAAPTLICAYIEHAADELGHRPASISRRVSSIAHWHRAHGYRGADNPAGAEIVKLALRSVRRRLGAAQRQAQGITEGEIGMILAAHPKPGLKAIRDIAALLVARALLARRSELINLNISDVEFRSDGTALAVIRRSKTDQEGLGSVQYLGRRPASWLRRWMTAAGIADGASGPLLRTLVGRGGKIGGRMDKDDITRIFRDLARGAGIDPTGISSHSARVGQCQDLVAGGFDLAGVMQCGRWSSPAMVARYSARVAADRSVMAQYESRRAGAGLEPGA